MAPAPKGAGQDGGSGPAPVSSGTSCNHGSSLLRTLKLKNGMALMEVISKDTLTPGPAGPTTGRNEARPGMLEVNVASAADVDQALDEAIAIITDTAAYHRIGVLVTRTGAGSYIVRAHPAVPCGLIRQQHG